MLRRGRSAKRVCLQVLGQGAVHGAFAGFTGFTVGLVNTHYVYLPIPVIIQDTRKVDPKVRICLGSHELLLEILIGGETLSKGGHVYACPSQHSSARVVPSSRIVTCNTPCRYTSSCIIIPLVCVL